MIKLSIKYPKAVAAERFSVFLKNANVFGDTIYNEYSANIFDADTTNRAQQVAYTFDWDAYKPVVYHWRKA